MQGKLLQKGLKREKPDFMGSLESSVAESFCQGLKG
jgi:hypothetical protein